MDKEITFHTHESAKSYERFYKASLGLRKYGIESYFSNNNPKTKIVACWGWRVGEVLRKLGHDVLVFERAYLGDRFYWTSISWNGLNGHADFCLPEKVTSEKFLKHFSLKPWISDDARSKDKIIIMGQISGDMSLQGQNLTEFYEKAAWELQSVYQLPVFFKPHPAGGKLNFKPKIHLFEGDLDQALSESKLIVTYNSNSGVDAVINGVPALSFDSGSMAWPVTGHKIDDRIKPEREEWAFRLAHCQWSPEEIEAGKYWENLQWKPES